MRCKGWQQEAALLMLENNLHPDVAERPEDLVVYGGIGKAARNQASLAAIKAELQRLAATQTPPGQPGKPSGGGVGPPSRCSCSPASRSACSRRTRRRRAC